MTQTSKTTTRTYFVVTAHRYLENTPCDAPARCTKKSHWMDSYETSDPIDMVLDAEDAPYIRVEEVTEVTTRKFLEEFDLR
jgi:hypothetical protein